MEYLLSLPKSYSKDGKAWPLILFLHGAGSAGSDLNRIKRNGIPKILASKSDSALDEFIVVSPQNRRGGWNPQALNALLDDLVSNLNADKDRL